MDRNTASGALQQHREGGGGSTRPSTARQNLVSTPEQSLF